MYRLLCDPSPEPSGGGETKPADPGTVTLTAAQYKELQAGSTRLQEIERAKAADLEAKEAARLQALADKGQAQEALRSQEAAHRAKLEAADKRSADLEGRYHAELKRAALGAATAGVIWSSPVAGRDALEKLGALFETAPDPANPAGPPRLQHRVTGKPASECVPELLDGPDFAHFRAPGGTGRGGLGGGDRAAPSGTGPAGAGGMPDVVGWVQGQIEAQTRDFEKRGLAQTPGFRHHGKKG